MKSKRHYLDRAAYMRRLAKDAATEKLRESCLKKAEELETQAQRAEVEGDKDKK
jgi:hypothetical protein